MSPLPSGSVMPDNWSAHHQDAAEGFLTGRADGLVASFVGDIEAGEEIPAGGFTPLWQDQPCSAQVLSRSNEPETVVGQVQVPASHRISVSLKLETLTYGNTIRVVSNPDDPSLNGRDFIVRLIERGTTNWTRDYLCEEVNSQ